jgi:arylsulfatase A-like enzyme
VKKFNEPPVPAPKNNGAEKHHFDPYPHAAFAAMVARLDKYVGEIMSSVKAKGLEENTWILFASDNGPHKENGGDPQFFNSSGGLRGIKRDLYEGGIRDPLIVYKKGATKAGTVNNTPVVMYDLFPTFLEIAGVISNVKTDGQSVVRSFKGLQQTPHTYLYWEFHEGGGSQAVRLGDWKAVKLNVSKNKNAPIELYNLKDDPAEKKNVAGENPVIVRQVEKIFGEAHVSNKDWPLLVGEKVMK